MVTASLNKFKIKQNSELRYDPIDMVSCAQSLIELLT